MYDQGEEDLDGLDTTIDWKNTSDNSYDGEKLQLLIHDESGKWERPENILNNWRVTKTCLRLGSKIIGKCMMGSTSNALDRVVMVLTIILRFRHLQRSKMVKQKVVCIIYLYYGVEHGRFYR